MVDKITAHLVRTAPAPATGNSIIYDTDVKGFGLRITAKGARSFVLNYHLAGQERRLTIGSPPVWTVAAAREEAKALKRKVDQGQDPLGDKRAEREAPTVTDLWAEYSARHLSDLAPKNQKDVTTMWVKYILPRLGGTKLSNLTYMQIDNLHRSIPFETRANRVAGSLRSALNDAIKWNWIAKNVANGFRRNTENPREYFLSAEQLADAFAALERMKNKRAAEAIHLLILTGCRRGEALTAEWSQFDLDRGVWTKPSSHTKQRRLHRTPLSPEAVILLQRMQATSKSDFLFPNGARTGPLQDIKKPWLWLKKELALPNLRLHDLRHTFASHLISQGEGLPVVGKLLGHTQNQTTMRYAHLLDEPLRKATNKIGKLVTDAQKGN